MPTVNTIGPWHISKVMVAPVWNPSVRHRKMHPLRRCCLAWTDLQHHRFGREW